MAAEPWPLEVGGSWAPCLLHLLCLPLFPPICCCLTPCPSTPALRPLPQVLLYLLLMEERYGRPLDWGMLWYTHQPGEAAMRGMPLGWTLQLGLHILCHL